MQLLSITDEIQLQLQLLSNFYFSIQIQLQLHQNHCNQLQIQLQLRNCTHAKTELPLIVKTASIGGNKYGWLC